MQNMYIIKSVSTRHSSKLSCWFICRRNDDHRNRGSLHNIVTGASKESSFNFSHLMESNHHRLDLVIPNGSNNSPTDFGTKEGNSSIFDAFISTYLRISFNSLPSLYGTKSACLNHITSQSCWISITVQGMSSSRETRGQDISKHYFISLLMRVLDIPLEALLTAVAVINREENFAAQWKHTVSVKGRRYDYTEADSLLLCSVAHLCRCKCTPIFNVKID